MKYFYACVLFFNFIFVTARITFSSYKCFNQNVSSLFQVLLTLNRWIMKINYLPNQEDQEDSLLTISVFALILPFNPRKRCSRNVWGCSSPLSWQGSARYETMAAVSGVSLWQQQDLLTPSLLHLHSHLTLTLSGTNKAAAERHVLSLVQRKWKLLFSGLSPPHVRRRHSTIAWSWKDETVLLQCFHQGLVLTLGSCAHSVLFVWHDSVFTLLLRRAQLTSAFRPSFSLIVMQRCVNFPSGALFNPSHVEYCEDALTVE